MAQMIQHPSKPTLDASLWTSEPSPSPSLSPSLPASESSSARTLDNSGIVVLRSPSAALTSADEQAAETEKSSVFQASSTKRQCIIIPGEYRSPDSDANRRSDASDNTNNGPRPQLVPIDTSAISLKEAQAVAAATNSHLATPTDSNPGRRGSFENANGDGTLLFSPKSELHSRGSAATAASAAPSTQRRRQPFKIVSGSSAKALYCASSPSLLLAGPSSLTSAPISGTIALSSKDVLRRTRSQSPTQQPLSLGPLGMSDPEISVAASLSGDSVSSGVRLAHRRRLSVRGAEPGLASLSFRGYSVPKPEQTISSESAAAAAVAAAAAAAAEVAASSLPSPQMHTSDFEQGASFSSIVQDCDSNQKSPGSKAPTHLLAAENRHLDLAAAEENVTAVGACGNASWFGAESGSGGFDSADARFGNAAADGKPRHAAGSRELPHFPPGGMESRPTSTILMVAATDENSLPVLESFAKQPAMEPNWFKRQTMRSNTNDSSMSLLARAIGESDDRTRQQQQGALANAGSSTPAHYEKLMLRAQEQRDAAMAEASALQQQLIELRRDRDLEVEQLRQEVSTLTRKLGNEYELRTAAETKCSLMECELAELSSNIQFEAQNLVAQERRGHRNELDRVARRHEEIEQLLEMERAQVGALKKSLEATSLALDRERSDANRMRSGMQAFERQMAAPSASKLSTEETSSAAPSLASQALPEPHITGAMYFGGDGSRPDTRLAEFLGFLNAASDKEAMAGLFMQRSMREDVVPTLLAEGASNLPSLSSWHRHRRLLHSVQDNTLLLESFAPRRSTSRVLSVGCYLCGCSTNRPSTAGSSSISIASSSLDRGLSTSISSAETAATGRTQPSSGGLQRCEMYRMRFSDNDEDNKPLCHHCHGRMVAVCSFFAYLKIVRKGLIKRPIADIWLEVNKTRLQMWLARSGASSESRLSITLV
ncbi:RAB3A interacting protein [Coemansia sp. RSA 485]|nr:RAB3A interacting protein [Coemansia sp. RSA 485]